MENAPVSFEDNSEKSTTKKKKRGEALGMLAVEPKASEPERRPEPPRLEPEQPPRPMINLAEAIAQASKNKEADDTLDDEKSDGPNVEAEPLTESEAEMVMPEEKPVVEQQVASVMREQHEEQAHDPEADDEKAYGDQLISEMYDHIEQTGDFENADSHVIAEHDLTEFAEDVPEAVEDSEVVTEENDVDTEILEADESSDRVEPTDEIVFDRAAAHEADDTETPEDTVTPPSAGGSVPPVPPVPPLQTGGSGSGSGGRGTVPPRFGGAAPLGGGPSFGGGAPFGGTPRFNTAPTTTPNTDPLQHTPEYRTANPATMALFGGVIGYLIGRRRGRIKTEKKLLPIQKKLEKQVEDMSWELKAKETKLRLVAAEKIKHAGPAVVERTPDIKPVVETAPNVDTARQNTEARNEVVAATPPERRRAPEARQLHGEQKAEHIGQMLIAAELTPAARIAKTERDKVAARKPETANIEKKIAPEKQVMSMNRAELLAVSETIIIEGASLRETYENNLIGEQGLRRLVTEHLRGGDVKKALRQEIREREIDFERDPAMRDVGASAGAVQGGGTVALNRLVEKASAQVAGGSDNTLQYATPKKQQQTDDKPKNNHRQMADIALGTTIAVLLALIIAMYLLRR